MREGERLLNEGNDLTEVLRHLGISEATWNRWGTQYAGMKGEEQILKPGSTRPARLSKEHGRPLPSAG